MRREAWCGDTAGQLYKNGDAEGGGAGGGRAGVPRRAAVGGAQLHPRRRLHRAAARLPAGKVQAAAERTQAPRIPARARLQGPLQRHRRGEGGDRGAGGGARGDGGGGGGPAQGHHARPRRPRQELHLQRAEPARRSEQPRVQGARHPAAVHGAARVHGGGAHPDRDHQIACSAAEDPVPDLHAAAGRDLEEAIIVVVIQEEEMTGKNSADLLMDFGRSSSPAWPGHAVPLEFIDRPPPSLLDSLVQTSSIVYIRI